MRRLTPLALAAMLVACAGPGPNVDDGRLHVVATTSQVGEVARVVGGDAIDLTVLLPPGADAHDFELTTRAAAAIERADVILKSGAGLESWLDGAIETIGGAERVRDMSRGVELRQAEDGSVDPHYWLSAPNAVAMVENVRDALVEVDPGGASAFEGDAAAYVERLEAADAEIRALIEEIPEERRAVVTNHDALGYFLDAYGLRFVGSVFPAVDVAAEPNPQQLAALVETIRESGVRAIFSESAVNPALAAAIASETDAVVVDEPLYADSLGPPGTDAATLDGMLLHDARVISRALSS